MASERDEVAAEVARRRQESIAEAEAEIEGARQEGRSMVSEARACASGCSPTSPAPRRRPGPARRAARRARPHRQRHRGHPRPPRPADGRPPGRLARGRPRPAVGGVRAGPPCVTRATAAHLVRPLHPVHQEREPIPPGAHRGCPATVSPHSSKARTPGPSRRGAPTTATPPEVGARTSPARDPEDTEAGLGVPTRPGPRRGSARPRPIDTDPSPRSRPRRRPEDAAEPPTAGPRTADAATGDCP